MNPPAKRQRTNSDSNTQSVSQSNSAMDDIRIQLAKLEEGLKAFADRPTTVHYNNCQVVHNHQVDQANFAGGQQPAQQMPEPQPGSRGPLSQSLPAQYPQHPFPPSSAQFSEPNRHDMQQSGPAQQPGQAQLGQQLRHGPPAPPQVQRSAGSAPQPVPQVPIACPLQPPNPIPSGYPPTPPNQMPSAYSPPPPFQGPERLLGRVYKPRPTPPGIVLPSPEQLLAELSESDLRTVLKLIIPLDSTGLVESAVIDYYIVGKLSKDPLPESFDEESKTVWYAFDDPYLHLSPTEQYEKSYVVTAKLLRCIETINAKVTTGSLLATKVNALRSLCSIAQTVLLSRNSLGHEARKRLEHEHDLINVMESIIKNMPQRARLAASQSVDKTGEGNLLSRLEWVGREAVTQGVRGLDVRKSHSMLRGDLDRDELMAVANESEGEEADDEGAEDDPDAEVDHGYYNEAKAISRTKCDLWKFIDFDICASNVESIIKYKYCNLNDADGHGKSRNAYIEIQTQIELIRQETSSHLSLVSKGKALTALIKISCCVVASGDSFIAQEIRRHFRHDNDLCKLIQSILDGIDEYPRTALFRKINVAARVEHLIEHAQRYGVHCFDSLRNAID